MILIRKRNLRILLAVLLAVTATLSAVLSMPGASNASADTATASYDINDVGSVTFSDLTDVAKKRSVLANDNTYVGDWLGWKHFNAIATLDVHIDDMAALGEGDTVTIPLSHTGRFDWATLSVLPTVRNGVGDIVFNVEGTKTAITLTRTAALAVGSADFQLQPVIDGWYGLKPSIGYVSTLTAGGSSVTFSSPELDASSAAGIPLTGNVFHGYNTANYANYSTMTARMMGGKSHNSIARGQTPTDNTLPWIFHFHITGNDGHAVTVRRGWLQVYSYAAYNATTMGYTFAANVQGGHDMTMTEGDLSVRGGWTQQTNEDGSVDIWFNAGSLWGDNAAHYNEGASSYDEVTNQYLKATGYLADNVDGNFDIGFDSATEQRSASVTCDVTNNGTTTTVDTLTIKNTPVSGSSMNGQSGIEYVGNGATGGEYLKTTAKPGTATTTAPASQFARDGYEFTGWNTGMDGSGDAYAANADITYPSEGVTLTLYAQWKRTTHEVSFDTNGGSKVDTQTVADGDTASKPTPTRKGWTFDGWYLNGVEYDFDTPVTTDVSLKAAWRKTDATTGTATMHKRVTRDTDSYTVSLDVTGKASDTTLMRNVTVTDPLSQWVDPVGLEDGEGTGVTVLKDGKAMTSGYTAVYDKKSRTVSVAFDGALDDGSVYKVSFDVRTNAKATLDYMTSGEYPDTGDEDTGDTSAGLRGYPSNGTAVLSWDAVTVTDGVPETVPSTASYAHPVVQFIGQLPPVLVGLLPGTGARMAIVPMVAGAGVLVALGCAWYIRKRLA